MKGSAWRGPGISPPAAAATQDLVQLVYGGRERPGSGGSDTADLTYLAARAQLEHVWGKHGQDESTSSYFYDQYANCNINAIFLVFCSCFWAHNTVGDMWLRKNLLIQGL